MGDLRTYFEKFQEVVNSLKQTLIERDEVIEGIACGFMSQTNVLLIGEPGTAKSLVINKFAKMMGMDSENGYFHYLLTKYTEPAEVLGTVDITKLREGKYEIITKNKLPEASVVFLDEVFNANSAILNSLLTIINEKKLIIGNIYKDMSNLMVVYGASNHVPDDPLLKAFFDRFPIRVKVDSISPTDNNIKTLLDKEFKIENESISKQNEVNLFNREEAIEFSKMMNQHIVDYYYKYIKESRELKNVLRLLRHLKENGVFISDRNIKNIIKNIIAHTILKSEKLEPKTTDDDSIRFIVTKIWNKEEEKDEIERLLM